MESIGKAIAQKKDWVLVKTVTFFSTCAVNVPLGVWKDVRFVQIFGRNRPIASEAATRKAQLGPISTPQNTVLPAKFPRVVGATFLLRDALTILGSFTLPQMLSSSVPSWWLADPVARMAATQLLVPVLSQVVVTPVHLLGLDLYSNPQKGERGERVERIRSNLGSTTMVRCARIVPAFGVGGIVNTSLRRYFHRKAGMRNHE